MISIYFSIIFAGNVKLDFKKLRNMLYILIYIYRGKINLITNKTYPHYSDKIGTSSCYELRWEEISISFIIGSIQEERMDYNGI
jgi:hypothetical protein